MTKPKRPAHGGRAQLGGGNYVSRGTHYVGPSASTHGARDYAFVHIYSVHRVATQRTHTLGPLLQPRDANSEHDCLANLYDQVTSPLAPGYGRTVSVGACSELADLNWKAGTGRIAPFSPRRRDIEWLERSETTI